MSVHVILLSFSSSSSSSFPYLFFYLPSHLSARAMLYAKIIFHNINASELMWTLFCASSNSLFIIREERLILFFHFVIQKTNSSEGKTKGGSSMLDSDLPNVWSWHPSFHSYTYQLIWSTKLDKLKQTFWWLVSPPLLCT